MKARTDLLPCPNGSADGTNHHHGINYLAFVAMSRAKKRARSRRRFHLRFHRGNVEQDASTSSMEILLFTDFNIVVRAFVRVFVRAE